MMKAPLYDMEIEQADKAKDFICLFSCEVILVIHPL